VVNGKIYVIGGFVPDGSGSGGGSRLAINEVYDPVTDSWTTKTPMPIAGLSYISAVVDNEIYITDSKMKNQIYNVETDTWRLGASPPSDIGHGAAGATTGVNSPKRIYVLTEMLGGESRFNQVYDPEHDSWTFGVAVPTSRLDFGVAVVDDVLYVIGGYTSSYPDMPYSYPYGPSNTPHATNEQYTPFGYGTPDPSYDGTPPEVAVASPENKTYYTADAASNSTDIALDFTVDEPVFSVRFVLDGGTPVEISGNTTLAGLAIGVHNVTVYGFDASGNMGTSETLYFTIEEPAPFPTPVVVASAVVVAAVGLGLLIYFKKRKR
jgi:hypothetical protein